MAYLIGSVSTARFSSTYAIDSGAGGTGLNLVGDPADTSASATGTAENLHIYVSSWGSQTNIKCCIYDETALGALLETVIIPSSEGTGLITVALAGTTTITSGSNYRLGIYTEDADPITMFSDTSGLTLRKFSTSGSYTAPADPSNQSGGYDSFNEFYFAIDDVSASGLILDTSPTDITRGSTGSFVVSNPATTPTTGNTSILNGGDSLTVTSVTGSDPYTINFTCPASISKLHSATGYPWTITIAAENVVSGNVPLLAPSGWSYIDVATPDTGAEVYTQYNGGGVFVTGDQWVYESTTTAESIAISFDDALLFTLASTPSADQTLSGYRIDTSGAIHGTSSITITIPTGVDVTPDAFTFTDATGVEPNTLTESNTITITGVDAGEDIAVTVVGGEYAVDAGAGFGGYTATGTNVQLNYDIKVRGTSNAAYEGTADVALTAGGVSDTFTMTTRAEAPDSVAPIIILNGVSPLTVEQGAVWTDPQATVTDNVDATKQISADNTPTMGTVGSYVLNYNTTDAAGNPAIQVQRTVNVTAATATVAPTIATVGGTTISQQVGSAYSDPAWTASDDVGAVAVTWSGDTVDINTVAVYTRTATATNGIGSDVETYEVTVSAADVTPNQMNLGADVVDAEPGATTQRQFTIAGIDAGQTVNVTATGSATVSAATGQLGDTITVSLVSNAAFDGVVTGGAEINGVSDSFSITTRSTVAITENGGNPMPSTIAANEFPYNLSQHVTNPDGLTLNYALAAGSAALNAGLTLNSATGEITASGTTNQTVSNITFEVTAV